MAHRLGEFLRVFFCDVAHRQQKVVVEVEENYPLCLLLGLAQLSAPRLALAQEAEITQMVAASRLFVWAPNTRNRAAVVAEQVFAIIQ